jgi:hypothetical protein
MFLAVYNSFAVTYQYTFKDEFFNLPAVVIMETMIDILFFFDIIIMFFTSFVDHKGIENFNKDEIALNYIK